MESSEENLTALFPKWNAGGLRWEDIGNATQADIDGLKNTWFADDAEFRLRLQSIWVRHPNRMRGI